MGVIVTAVMVQLQKFHDFGNIEEVLPVKTLSPRLAYALAGSVIGLALFASVTPSPLYGTYSELWGFSPAVLTLVFATYAFGVLTTLMLAGRVSDEVGRRPVLLVALGSLLVTTVVYMLAQSVVWLFVARGLQGLATGLAVAAASAALLDLHPRRDPAGAGLANGVASAAGLGLGMLVSSSAVEWLPAPRVIPYVVLFVLFAIAFTGALLMPEPVEHRTRLRLTPQRPGVPPVVRRPFLLAGLGVLSSWSIGGLFFSLGPALSALIFDTSNHFVTGLSVVLLAGSGAISQLAFGRTAPWLGTSVGSIALAIGLLLIVVASAEDSAALLLAASLLSGTGFGVAFLGSLRQLVGAIPNEHRAEVMSAFYVVAYSSLSVPAILAGILVTPLGLQTTFEIFGSVVAAIALVLAFEAWRTRPQQRRVAITFESAG
jgi:MFS family permease